MGRYAAHALIALLFLALAPLAVADSAPGTDGASCSFTSDCALGFLCAQKINGGALVCIDPRVNAIKRDEKIYHLYEERLGIEVTRSIFIVPILTPGTGATAVTFVVLTLREVGGRTVDITLSERMPAGLTPEQARQMLFNPRPLDVVQADGRYFANWRFNVTTGGPSAVNYTLPLPVAQDLLAAYPAPDLSDKHDDPLPVTGFLSTIASSPIMVAVLLVAGFFALLFVFSAQRGADDGENAVVIQKLKQVLWKHPKEDSAHARRLKDI